MSYLLFCVFSDFWRSLWSYTTEKKQNCSSVLVASWSSSKVFLLLRLLWWRLQTPAVRRMFPLHSPIEARTESFKEEEVVVTKYEEVQLQERRLTISSNNITIKLETKVLKGKIMLKGPPAAAHLSTVHVQTLVNCKLLLLVNNVNFNKIVLDMGGLSTSRWYTLMKDEPSP